MNQNINDDDFSDTESLSGMIETDTFPCQFHPRMFPNKVGGKPAWLSRNPPKCGSIICDNCNTKMVFALQIYTPDDSNAIPHAYHRSIYVFLCQYCTVGVTVLRSTLPWIHPDVDPQIPTICSDSTEFCCNKISRVNWQDITCSRCGLEYLSTCNSELLSEKLLNVFSANKLNPEDSEDEMTIEECPESNPDEQKEWKVESSFCEITYPDGKVVKKVIEGNKSAKDVAAEVLGPHSFERLIQAAGPEATKNLETDIPMDDNDENEFGAEDDTTGELDFRNPIIASISLRPLRRFQRRLREGEIIRYHRGDKPHWVGEGPNKVIPDCQYCGAPREFEFQILPAYLASLKKVNKLRFATVAIYCCTAECNTNFYNTEFALRQEEPRFD